MGAGTPRMFAELRLPTLAELDAAVPDRPVFLYQGGGGPARTNTLGKQFFESATAPLAGPCVVGDDGSLINTGGVNHANRALYHLRVRQTFEDKKRSALDAMAFSASVGVNALIDQTLVAAATGTLDPASLDPQPTHALFTLNHYYRMYDAWLALHAEGRALVRLQLNAPAGRPVEPPERGKVVRSAKSGACVIDTSGERHSCASSLVRPASSAPRHLAAFPVGLVSPRGVLALMSAAQFGDMSTPSPYPAA
jgi:predicted amidohydrolase YtcJ